MVLTTLRFNWCGKESHPAHDHGRLDAVIQPREVARAEAANRKPDATYAVLVHLWSREQVIHCAEVIPEHHPRPRETGGEDRTPDELLALS